MKLQQHKNQEKKNSITAQRKANRQAPSSLSDASQVRDIAQLKRQKLVDNSPQVSQLKVIQNKANNSPVVQQKANNTGLPNQLKSGVENLSGIAMDDVKVHYNSSKPAQLQAHAYAQGTDIHLGPGQEKHLPHEAWHVVQQKQGRVQPTTQLKGKVNVNDDAGLEREADVMGGKAMQMKRSIKKIGPQKTEQSLQQTPLIQRKPALVKGRTHLVKKVGNSLMKGNQQKELVYHNEQIDVNTNTRLRSRRGPNQELVGDYDTRDGHIYRWYLVNDVHPSGGKLQNLRGKNLYIREGTFVFERGNHAKDPIALMPGQERRSRKSHYAVRFEVWYNSHYFDEAHEHKEVDQSGHMVMKDMSAAHRHEKPYYAYEQGGAQAQPGEFPRAVERTMDKDAAITSQDQDKITVDGFSSRHSELDARNETEHEVTTRLRGQKRIFSATSERWVPHRPDKFKSHQTKKESEKITRFDKRKWIEILVTKDEFDHLISMFKERKEEGGFYTFLREARTSLGYKLATRCLSFLEDIAIERGKTGLATGHAKDVLKDFARINQVTKGHKGKGGV